MALVRRGAQAGISATIAMEVAKAVGKYMIGRGVQKALDPIMTRNAMKSMPAMSRALVRRATRHVVRRRTSRALVKRKKRKTQGYNEKVPRKKRRVVRKTLKQKVLSIVHGEGTSARITEVQDTAYQPNGRNEQFVIQNTNQAGTTFMNFGTYAEVNNFAAIAYNAKAAAETGGEVASTTVGNFDTDVKIAVLWRNYKQSVTNLTGVSGTLHRYVCHPKMEMVGNNVGQSTAFFSWAVAMQTEAHLPAVPHTYAQPNEKNFGEDPMRHSKMHKDWNIVHTKKFLLPGQKMMSTVSHGYQVYNNEESKRDIADNFYWGHAPGKSFSVFYIWRPSLQAYAVDKTHSVRQTYVGATGKGILAFETIKQMMIECPDEAAIANRHNVVVRLNWKPANAEATTNLWVDPRTDQTLAAVV